MKILSLTLLILACFYGQSAFSIPKPVAKPIAINVVTDENGVKLYVLEFDSNHEVNCYGDCNKEWPEIRVETAKSSNVPGVAQLTLNNKPLGDYDPSSKSTRNGTERDINEWHIIIPQ